MRAWEKCGESSRCFKNVSTSRLKLRSGQLACKNAVRSAAGRSSASAISSFARSHCAGVITVTRPLIYMSFAKGDRHSNTTDFQIRTQHNGRHFGGSLEEPSPSSAASCVEGLRKALTAPHEEPTLWGPPRNVARVANCLDRRQRDTVVRWHREWPGHELKAPRQMRRVLNQAANAAVKAKGTIFAIVYRRLVPRLGHAQAIGANRAPPFVAILAPYRIRSPSDAS
jgi:hypothetical protein